jgi:GR25 family glycosyltransferase involved in LPS biosynthesis
MKVDRALIIRRLKIPESIEMSNEVARGCEKFGIPYEFIDGIEFMSSEDAMKAVGVWLSPKQKRVSTGNNNCHASHIKAWRRIVEINKACVIFEHDVIVKGDVTNIDIIDDAVNIFGHRINDQSKYNPVCPIQNMTRIRISIGGHAYALTPNTAQWFINDAEENGVNINVDQWINKDCGKPLYITDPPQVVCFPRVSTREWIQEDVKHETHGATTTFAESYTPLCLKGYK